MRYKDKKRPTVERQHVVCEDSGDSGCDDETERRTAAIAKANADCETRTAASLPSSPRLASPAPTSGMIMGGTGSGSRGGPSRRSTERLPPPPEPSGRTCALRPERGEAGRGGQDTAGYGGIWRDMAGYGGIWSDMERYIKIPQNNRPD